jgi:hypothetical protein
MAHAKGFPLSVDHKAAIMEFIWDLARTSVTDLGVQDLEGRGSREVEHEICAAVDGMMLSRSRYIPPACESWAVGRRQYELPATYSKSTGSDASMMQSQDV